MNQMSEITSINSIDLMDNKVKTADLQHEDLSLSWILHHDEW